MDRTASHLPVWGRSTILALAAVLALTGCTGTTDGSDGTTTPGGSTVSSGVPRSPDSPGSGHPGWVVALGDSYISGEGARWGANTTGPLGRVDALGPDAYFDHHGQESRPGCHRAAQTVVDLGRTDLRGKNLACSGATTRSDASGVRFRPGLDFAREPDGDGVGQARALRRFAARHDVAAVVVSIGGNDFGFGALAGSCVTSFLAAGPRHPCRDDPAVTNRFSPAHRHHVEAKIRAALDRLTAAMSRAGYAGADYRRILLTYPSPVPPGSRLRFSDARRDLRDGCPLLGSDASWANQVAVPRIDQTVTAAGQAAGTPFEILDLRHALDGHRLCEQGTAKLSETRLGRWDAPGAQDRIEWVNQVYTTLAPQQIQESLHPNFWGTAAERACLRLVLDSRARASYECVGAGPGVAGGNPRMALR